MDSECKNCFLLNVSHNKKFKNKKLIQDISDNYDIDDLHKKSPAKKTIPIEIHHKLKQKNTWVLYWASNPSDDIVLKSDKEAYANNKNNGVTKTDSNGNLVLKLNCPSVYLLDKSTNPRHVHFVILKDKKWDTNNIHTAYILCDINFELMNKYVNSKQHMIVNAIDIKGSKYSDNIPNSFFLKMPKTGTKKVKKDVVTKFISKNIKQYPKLSKLVSENKLKKENVPFIVYCAHKKCDASKKLSKTLIDLGFNNVMDFSAGIEGWFNNLTGAMKDSDNSTSLEDKNNVDDLDDSKTITFDGVSYTVTSDNKVLDDDLKIIGRYVNKKIIFNKSEYKKKHSRLKKRTKSLYDDLDDEDDEDSDDDDSDDDTDDDDDKDEDKDKDDDDDDDEDEDEDKDDDDDDDEDEDEDDDDDEDDDEDDDLSLSKEEIHKIHKMSKKDLRKELKNLKNQLKTGGNPDFLVQTCGIF